MRRSLPFVIVGAVLLLTIGAGLLLFRSKSGPPLKLATGQPGAEPAHVRGSDKARVTLEEFGDFQCPPCGFLAATLLKVEHDYADRVRVVFREFPLAMHAHAMTAASAAEAAGLQGRFWEMHDLLFQNSVQWGKPAPRPSAAPGQLVPAPPEEAQNVRATFVEYAVKLGLDVERFKRDMETEEVKARIKLDQERGASVRVDRTPVLFIDGVQIPFTSLDEQGLRGVIDAALNGRTPVPASPPPSPTPAPK
jgi:protein-disulfide isomerase